MFCTRSAVWVFHTAQQRSWLALLYEVRTTFGLLAGSFQVSTEEMLLTCCLSFRLFYRYMMDLSQLRSLVMSTPRHVEPVKHSSKCRLAGSHRTYLRVQMKTL